MTRKLMQIAGSKILLALEGGYDHEVVADCTVACLQALSYDHLLIESSKKYVSVARAPCKYTSDIIKKVRTKLKAYWPILADKIPTVLHCTKPTFKKYTMGQAEDLLMLTIVVLVHILQQQQRRVRARGEARQKLCISSLTGNLKMRELLDGPSQQMFESFRMDKPSFVALCEHFRENGYLQSSKHLELEEKMMIFLMTISQNVSVRHMKWVFQHSGETINKYFHEVLWAMLKFSKDVIVSPDWSAPEGEIRHHRHLRENIFKGAVGALDGTLIHAVVPKDKQIPYRARGGKECWQSVMAIVDFDMKFLYTVAGWEGCAHDSKVLTETIQNPNMNFPIPPEGKYYMCDAAYTHTRGFMTPYRQTRYWLTDFRRNRARTKQEKFNHAHALLRNVIERAFGVLKARFPILQRMPPYRLTTQRNIAIACMAIHNFLRRVALNDPLFTEYENEDLVNAGHDGAGPSHDGAGPSHDGASSSYAPPPVHNFQPEDQLYMVNLREEIANQLAGSAD